MNRFKLIITLLNIPRLLLHILFYLQKRNICRDDVVVQLKHRRLHCSELLGFMYILVFDKTYRNLFYWRIGKLKYLCYYWLPPHPCFVIGINQTIGKGVLGIHPYGTFVNAEKIGDYFSVKNNVTIGYNKAKRPLIGNNVTVNANSVIVGGISIGDNSVIGIGSVVMKNVPANCVVVGNPARIIRREGIRVNETL